MNTTDRLLDAYKVKLGLPSDYALSKHWHMTPQRVANWRKGVSGIAEERALSICTTLEIDPAPVLIELQAERARKSKRYDVAAVFEGLLRKLAAGVPALCLCLGLLSMPKDIEAKENQGLAVMPSAFLYFAIIGIM